MRGGAGSLVSLTLFDLAWLVCGVGDIKISTVVFFCAFFRLFFLVLASLFFLCPPPPGPSPFLLVSEPVQRHLANERRERHGGRPESTTWRIVILSEPIH